MLIPLAMSLYKNKYRIESTRLEQHDYASPGDYFITICTFDRHQLFGAIADGVMSLRTIGVIAEQCWKAIPDHFAGMTIDAFVVMPDHIHGIITIMPPSDADDATAGSDAPVGIHTPRTFGPLQRRSISSIVNAYKSSVTRECRKRGITDRIWQPGFYDHIIRDERALIAIRRYIDNNVAEWDARHRI